MVLIRLMSQGQTILQRYWHVLFLFYELLMWSFPSSSGRVPAVGTRMERGFGGVEGFADGVREIGIGVQN
jgi:hypothetical protein